MEISVDEALKKGVDAHRAGDLQGAERFYRTILEADPDHSDANHNMGVLAVGVGKMPEALPFFKKATLTNPSIHQYWLSYIESLNKLGDTKEAWHVLGKAKGFDLPQQLIDKMEAIISKQKLCINSDLLLLRDNGKFSDAISLAQKLLAKGKQDPEILSFIAQCHILNNDLENGELFLKKATEVDSSISSISWNKARLFLKKREFSKALETALKTKSHLSKKDESLAILGACYFSNGNYKAANEAIEKALSINPDNAEALVNKALILLKNGNKVDALENLIFAFDRKPHLRQIWEILMSLASELERYDQAISISEKIIEFDNQNAKAYAYLGECHSKIGNDIQAIEAFDQAIEINPNYADAHYNKGVCLNSLTEQQKAIECYKKAIKINPNYADAFYNLGVSYFEQGQIKNSISAFSSAISLVPTHAKAYTNLIVALTSDNQMNEVERICLEALRHNPGSAKLYHRLSTIKTLSRDDKHIKKMITLVESNDISSSDRGLLCNALYNIYDKLDDIDRAFYYLSKGNFERKKNVNYEISRDVGFFKFVKDKHLECISLDNTYKYPNPDVVPIFILGMPRSGTSLIEQIISGHSDISGAGELKYLGDAYEATFSPRFSSSDESSLSDMISNFRSSYLTNLQSHSNGEKFITDKLPRNFFYIGMIRLAIPEAKIIHVIREPIATCWSNYCHYFKAAGLGYSFDLQEIKTYYTLYAELMRYWNGCFKSHICNLNYDELTENSESEILNLFQYLNMTPEELCFHPHRNLRTVETSSELQVKKPIYKQSSKRWRRYSKKIGSIWDSLS